MFLLLMTYLRIALRKNLFIDSLAEHLKKNHENAECINFQFHNLNLVKKGILDFMLLQPLTYV